MVALVFLLAASPARADADEPTPADPSPQGIRALMEGGRFMEAERSARALVQRLEAEHGPEAIETAEGLDALVAALVKLGKSRSPKTRGLAERALTIKEKALGSEDPGLVQSLTNLGNILYDSGDYAGAKPYFERAVALAEKGQGPDHPDVARALNEAGKSFWQMGDYEVARVRFERALAILEKALGPDHLDLAQPINNLGVVMVKTGNYPAAQAYFERALAIREKHLHPDHTDLGRTLNPYGVVLRHLGDYAGSRRALERALAIQEKALGPEHPEVGLILDNIGTVLFETGDYPSAVGYYRRGLAVRENALGPEHPEVARSLNNLASLLAPEGETAEARRLLERALAIKEKALGPDHIDLGSTLNNLADLLARLGDTREARRLYERDLTICERALGPEAARLADPLIDLGSLALATGDHDGARRSFERALAIREKALGPNDRYVAFALRHLSELHRATGDRARARALSERALAIFEKKLGPDHIEVAGTLEDLADLLIDEGRIAEARPHLERTLAIRRHAVGPDHPEVARSLNTLAELELLAGNPGEALARALEAEEIARRSFRSTALSLSEAEALRFENVRVSGLDLALSGLVGRSSRVRSAGHAPPDAWVREGWNQVILSRALVLDEMALRHRRMTSNGDPDLTSRFESLKRARGRLARLIVRGPGALDPQRYLELIQDARAERDRAERALAEASAEFRRQLGWARIGLDDVARALPADSALVAYNLYRWHPGPSAGTPGPARAGHSAPGSVPSYLAFVLRSGAGAPAVVPLGPAARIDALVRAWRDQAARPPRVLAAARRKDESRYVELAEQLRVAVWEPLATYVGSARRILVVPDGSLNLVNLSTLPADQGRYLAESGPLIHYLSAERDLVGSDRPEATGTGILVMGDPDFEASPPALSARAAVRVAPDPRPDRSEAVERTTAAPVYRGPRSTCADFTSLRFRSLPRTRLEADRVAARFAGEDPLLELTGAEANEAAFKRAAAGRRVVHVATHAFVLQDRCSWAANDGGGPSPRGSSAPEDLRGVAGDNPLLLSGLALAGANRRAETGGREDLEDGILTAEEIASLDLSGVEWAVLSACETGLGSVRSGEGVLGLRRAFQVAGARTLIMSLWPVEDAVALEWMTRLYEARSAHLESAEAVQAAGRAMIDGRRREGRSTHPFYWGAFVAAGDWR